jgi:hypothetical protein
MLVTIPRSSRRRLSRRTAHTPIADEDATYAEVYEQLYEAAHLISRASRQLRTTQRRRLGFALQLVGDEIHDHIRQLPDSTVARPPLGSHRFRCDPADC